MPHNSLQSLIDLVAAAENHLVAAVIIIIIKTCLYPVLTLALVQAH